MFQGVKRRFNIISNSENNLVIDDYAHHPSEIKATLESLRLISKKKIITVIEPHRYSRLHSLLPDFIKSLKISDSIFILPVYSAGERVNKKTNNIKFCKLLKKQFSNKSISLVDNEINFFESLKKTISSGDNIIFLGAGKSTAIAERFCLFLDVKK